MKNLKLQQLFLDQLKDFYGAEIYIATSLPKMITSADSDKLKSLLDSHLQVTQNQIAVLEKVFENLDETPQGQPGPAVKGLLKEGMDIGAVPDYDQQVHDAALIIAARKIHYYEMASYGSLVALASEMNDKETAELLGGAEPDSGRSVAGL